jgi:hypothetical protein
VRGDIFDEAGPGAHLSGASRTGMVYAYGRWLGFLSRSDPDSLRQALENRITRKRLVSFCEFLAQTNSAVSIVSALKFLQAGAAASCANERPDVDSHDREADQIQGTSAAETSEAAGRRQAPGTGPEIDGSSSG